MCDSNLLVSVIVPVYNKEKYLDKCIACLLGQTYQNLDFVFVNDGSVDGSELIIKKYAEKDSRFQLINQENQGVGMARNTGVKYARGNFVTFVDPDDLITSDMIELMVEAEEEHCADMVCVSFREIVEKMGATFARRLKIRERGFNPVLLIPKKQ